eukprot:14432512-Ditylum_brightwellii.AAC.2
MESLLSQNNQEHMIFPFPLVLWYKRQFGAALEEVFTQKEASMKELVAVIVGMHITNTLLLLNSMNVTNIGARIRM